MTVAPDRHRVLVAVLVVLAGCSGLAEPREAPSVEVTPAPVPTDTPTPAPPQLAPGVTAEGVVDPRALADAHAAVLRNTSKTVRTNETSWYAGYWVLRSHRHQVTRVAADPDRFHTAIEVDGPAAPFSAYRVEFWSDGERLLRRTVDRDGIETAVVPPESRRNRTDAVVGRPDSRTVPFLFGLVETRVTSTFVRNGTTVYWIESTGLLRPRALASAENVSDPHDVELRALVDSRGFVRSLRFAYAARVDGRRIWVQWTTRYTDVGTTTVDRPAWYDGAVNATGDRTAAARGHRSAQDGTAPSGSSISRRGFAVSRGS